MGKTRHIQKRMSQRGIRQSLLRLALEFGREQQNGKVILNAQGLKNLISECQALLQTAHQGLKKGGVVVVESEDGELITTYAVNSFRNNMRNAGEGKG